MAATGQFDPAVSCFSPLWRETGNEWKPNSKRMETAAPKLLHFQGFQETTTKTYTLNLGNGDPLQVSSRNSTPLHHRARI